MVYKFDSERHSLCCISALTVQVFHSYFIPFTTYRKEFKSTEVPSCRIIFEYVKEAKYVT